MCAAGMILRNRRRRDVPREMRPGGDVLREMCAGGDIFQNVCASGDIFREYAPVGISRDTVAVFLESLAAELE